MVLLSPPNPIRDSEMDKTRIQGTLRTSAAFQRPVNNLKMSGAPRCPHYCLGGPPEIKYYEGKNS